MLPGHVVHAFSYDATRNTTMNLDIDHVAFAWDDLDALTDRFAQLGLDPDYGGAHGGGGTHMSVLGFDDGSYIELIAPDGDPNEGVPFWERQMRTRAGPCAWCVAVDDASAAVKRAVDAGVAVGGPWYNSRERPDGVRVEWDMAFLGVDQANTGDQSWVLPFYICDRTPRSYRVQPSESVASGPFTGIGTVVVAVDEFGQTVDRLQRLYGIPTPVTEVVDAIDAKIAAVPGSPVALATPASRDSWLTERLSEVGPGPCSYLLETDDLEQSSDRLKPVSDWPTGRAAWFDEDVLDRRLGAVERHDS